MKTALVTSVIAAGLACSAHAAPSRAAQSAAHPATQFSTQEIQESLLDSTAYADVRVGQRVTLPGFPLAEDVTVDLDLERFTVLTDDAQTLVVDEHNVAHDVDLGVVLLKGTIAGDDMSRVYISTSPYGVHGYVKSPNATYSISTGPAGQHLVTDTGVIVADAQTIPAVERPASICLDSPDLEVLAGYDVPTGYADMRGLRASRETEYAMDSDWEYTDVTFGGDAFAANAYFQTLIGAVSLIYESDLDTQLKINFTRTFAANTDPYPGFDYSDRHLHLKGEWDANMPAFDRDGVHMFSGGSPSWGGIAYVSALCASQVANPDDYPDESFDYGVSAYLNGFFPSPIQDNNFNNWDLTVVAHELGHNHGTGHTHSDNWYDPTIDDCGNGDCSGACNATIMSYCHTCGAVDSCSGGMSNLDMTFHPRVQDTITFFLDNFAACVTAPSGPCAADIDGDGDADADDIAGFVNLFVGPGIADIDNDGDEDADDIAAFVNAFVAGC